MHIPVLQHFVVGRADAFLRRLDRLIESTSRGHERSSLRIVFRTGGTVGAGAVGAAVPVIYGGSLRRGCIGLGAAGGQTDQRGHRQQHRQQLSHKNTPSR